MKPNVLCTARRYFVIILTLVAVVWASLPAQGQQEVQCTTMKKKGKPAWECSGTIDLNGPVMFKVKNTLKQNHGFVIDSMHVMEVLKPGEEKTVTVPVENIDKSVSEVTVYCQLEGKRHMYAVVKVAGK